MNKSDVEFEHPKFLSPTKVLEEIGLESGDNVVDYGAGAGHWTFAAAKIVAPKGTVYAIDNNIELLQSLKSRAKIQRLTNIDIEELDLEKDVSKLEIKADLAILSNVLHSIKNKKELIEKIYTLLNNKGVLLVIDWGSENFLFGPAKGNRIKEEETMSICENAGFHFACTVDAGWHHFGMVFDKEKVSGKK